MNPLILNTALGLATVFGEHWMTPIQARLAVAHPELSKDELDAYDAESRKAMKCGHDLVPVCFRAAAGVQKEAYLLFRARLLERHAWITEASSSRLFSQGCYYAWKDGNMP